MKRSKYRFTSQFARPTYTLREPTPDPFAIQHAIEKLIASRVVEGLKFTMPHIAHRVEAKTWHIPRTHSSETGLHFKPHESADQIAKKIDEVIADDEMYESGEPRPSQETAARAKNLVMSAEQAGSRFPKSEISVYFGDIDITWRVQNRLLRLIVFSDPARDALLYFQTDNGESLTRGESVQARGSEELSRQLAWLLG